MCNTSNERIPEFSFIDGAQSLPRACSRLLSIAGLYTAVSRLHSCRSVFGGTESTASYGAKKLKIRFVTSDICLSNHPSDLNL